jgi:hypothetical protein
MKSSRIIRKAAIRVAADEQYSCLAVKSIAEDEGIKAPDDINYDWSDNPAVTDYYGVYTDIEGRIGGETFSGEVQKVPQPERHGLRVLLLLFAAEVLESEGK